MPWLQVTLMSQRAFRGELVALRPTRNDEVWEVVFSGQRITKIDLKNKRRL